MQRPPRKGWPFFVSGLLSEREAYLAFVSFLRCYSLNFDAESAPVDHKGDFDPQLAAKVYFFTGAGGTSNQSHEDYVAASELAQSVGTSSRSLVEVLGARGVKPITGPGVDDGRQFFFKREASLDGALAQAAFPLAEAAGF